MVSIGVGRVISAIYYFADSSRVSTTHAWRLRRPSLPLGIWDLIIMFGRVIGYLWRAWSSSRASLEMTYAPWYGGFSAAVSLLVIYVLSTTSSWTGSGERGI